MTMQQATLSRDRETTPDQGAVTVPGYLLVKRRKMVAKLWSGAGLLAAATALVFLASPTAASLWIGGLVVALGAALRIWASGHLLRNRELATSGPYAFVRDPLYLGRLLTLVGLCTMAWGQGWIVLLAGLVIFFLQYMPRKHAKEMDRLERRFGPSYARYAEQVRSLLPRLTPYPGRSNTRWSFRRFAMENKEPILLAAIAALGLLLVARLGWVPRSRLW